MNPPTTQYHPTCLPAAPWHLYYNHTHRPEWAALAGGYDYIWLPDDDLLLSTRDINTFFDIMREARALGVSGVAQDLFISFEALAAGGSRRLLCC